MGGTGRLGVVIILGWLSLAVPALPQNKDLGVKPAAVERRIALIIGNGAYQNAAPLKNPSSDAKLMAESLKSVGFQIVGGKPLIDADKATIERGIREFGEALQGGAVGLFYYSGHGVQVRGANYLIPVNANVTKESDIKYELVDAGFVLDEMSNAGNRLNIVILDACRNSPFGGRGLRAVSSGLAQVTAPAGTVISYATQPGNVANDGNGNNSPYTAALAAAIRKPGLDIFATFNDVGLTVKRSTGDQQQPWLATSPIEGQFYFAGLGSSGRPNPDAPPSTAPTMPDVSGPSGGNFSFDDIARQDAAAKAKWDQWQTAMKSAFDQAASFNGSAPAKRSVWDRFLAAYSEKNPYSSEDDRLRSEAAQRRAAIQDAPQLASVTTVPTALNPAPPTDVRSPGSVFRDCPNCPEMVVIPAGSFTMGSSSEEQAWAVRRGADAVWVKNESPQHQEAVRSFAMAKYDVTFDQWNECVADGGCNGYRPADQGWGQGNRPVINVSWQDAQTYVAWLNGRLRTKVTTSGNGPYRLPSEAEWEYAARAGTTGKWWCGDNEACLTKAAVYSANSDQRTQPVGSKESNPFGLYDMAGNVWQWTADCYTDTYAGAPQDGSANEEGTSCQRVERGGSWVSVSALLRSALRGRDPADSRLNAEGFRLARTLP